MDWTLFHALNDLQARTAWTHPAVRLIAKDGIGVFALLLLAGWIVGRYRGPQAVAGSVSAGAAAFLALAVNQVLGQVVDRARPYVAHPGVHLLLPRTSDFSFPSDHAAVAGAVAVGLLLVDRRLGLLALAGAVVMAVSRVYAGVHYPGDVVAGLVVGAASAVALHPVAVRMVAPVVERLGTTRLAPLVRA